MKYDLPIKYCRARAPYCNARVKESNYTLCCRYGWCGWAEPSQDRRTTNKAIAVDRERNIKFITSSGG